MTPPPQVMPALVTPFDDDGQIDQGAHRHNIEFLNDLGISGFVLGGSNGEGPYLEPGERARLVEIAREVAPDAHLMVGIMAESVRAGLKQMEETDGADSVLVMTPTTLTRGRPRAVLEYFRRIIEAAPLPVFLYSVPPNTAYSLEVDLISELADDDRVVGMKDSSGDVVRLQRIVDSTPDDFLLYSGASAAATAALTVGCHGVITGSCNYAAELVLDIVAQAPDRQLQSRLTRLASEVEKYGVPGVKAAASAYGLEAGLPRLPLEPLDPELAQRISRLVATNP